MERFTPDGVGTFFVVANATAEDDKGNTSEGKLYVRVLPDAQAPLWIEDPIRFTTYVNKPFIQSMTAPSRPLVESISMSRAARSTGSMTSKSGTVGRALGMKDPPVNCGCES